MLVKLIEKNWFWAIPALIIVVYAAWVWAQNRKAKSATDVSDLNKTVVLYNGINGYEKEVAYLQAWLNTVGQSVSVDGAFGPKTAAALFATTGKWEIALKDIK